jgi:hypothetical protein
VEHAFVFNEVAVLVRHWFEIDLIDSHLEHGARVELRLLIPQPRRGSESAAQKVVVDQPVWRADAVHGVLSPWEPEGSNRRGTHAAPLADAECRSVTRLRRRAVT